MKIGMFKKTLAVAGLILGVFFGNEYKSAQSLGNPGILPPNSHAFGRSYAEWSAAWWQWLLSIPAASNPNLANGNIDCGLGQTGKVWFLGGTFGGSAIRNCINPIPAGTALLITPLATLDGELEPSEVSDCKPGQCNINTLRELADATVANPQRLIFEIDGATVKNPDDYRVASPVFSAFLPDDAVFGISAGKHEPLVADGYWVLLAPLSPGHHTIHLKGVGASGFTVDVTYYLTMSK